MSQRGIHRPTPAKRGCVSWGDYTYSMTVLALLVSVAFHGAIAGRPEEAMSASGNTLGNGNVSSLLARSNHTAGTWHEKKEVLGCTQDCMDGEQDDDNHFGWTCGKSSGVSGFFSSMYHLGKDECQRSNSESSKHSPHWKCPKGKGERSCKCSKGYCMLGKTCVLRELCPKRDAESTECPVDEDDKPIVVGTCGGFTTGSCNKNKGPTDCVDKKCICQTVVPENPKQKPGESGNFCGSKELQACVPEGSYAMKFLQSDGDCLLSTKKKCKQGKESQCDEENSFCSEMNVCICKENYCANVEDGKCERTQESKTQETNTTWYNNEGGQNDDNRRARGSMDGGPDESARSIEAESPGGPVRGQKHVQSDDSDTDQDMGGKAQKDQGTAQDVVHAGPTRKGSAATFVPGKDGESDRSLSGDSGKHDGHRTGSQTNMTYSDGAEGGAQGNGKRISRGVDDIDDNASAGLHDKAADDAAKGGQPEEHFSDDSGAGSDKRAQPDSDDSGNSSPGPGKRLSRSYSEVDAPDLESPASDDSGISTGKAPSITDLEDQAAADYRQSIQRGSNDGRDDRDAARVADATDNNDSDIDFANSYHGDLQSDGSYVRRAPAVYRATPVENYSTEGAYVNVKNTGINITAKLNELRKQLTANHNIQAGSLVDEAHKAEVRSRDYRHHLEKLGSNLHGFESGLMNFRESAARHHNEQANAIRSTFTAKEAMPHVPETVPDREKA